MKRSSSKDGIRPRKGAYILPNLFTTASLFSGFYAIVAAVKGDFQVAAWAILISGILDGLDGRVARMTGTTSRFGVEYDSLADLVAFGVAPGMLGFMWGLQDFGRLGWLAAFLYVATTALRLARFNTLGLMGKGSSRYFTGLPCPSAAAMVATTVLMFQFMGIMGPVKHNAVLFMVYALSFLMVSNVRYASFKEVPWLHQHPFSSLVAFVLVLVVLAVEPRVTLFGVFFVYVLSGPLLYSYNLVFRRSRLKERVETPFDEEEKADGRQR